ncbi:MAG: hypothetical protein M9962_05080 [Oligoflexia bacterium]|nr:hypothetical protein [Oligoflexia bacterium]
MEDKRILTLYPLISVVQFLLPYIYIAPNFEGLKWALDTGYIPFLSGILFISFLVLFSMILVSKLTATGLSLFRISILVSLISSAYVAMSQKQHLLLIGIFCLFCISIYFSEIISRVLKRPYYFSKRMWWESYPKGILNIQAKLYNDLGEELSCRVSNIGIVGCYAFSEKGKIPISLNKVQIFFRDKKLLDVKYKVKSKTRDEFGIGLEFEWDALMSDSMKDFEECMSKLRKVGYDVSL